jgi:hypothetical protein
VFLFDTLLCFVYHWHERIKNNAWTFMLPYEAWQIARAVPSSAFIEYCLALRNRGRSGATSRIKKADGTVQGG